MAIRGLKKLALASLIMGLSLAGCLRGPGENPTQLTYNLPTTVTIGIGEALPGTDIVYQSSSDQGPYLLIQGQRALKRIGDSVNWKGTPLPGVSVDLKLRVLWHSEQELRLGGTAKVVIKNIQPRPAAISTSSAQSYSGPVAYGLAKGATIPGSNLTYEGETDDGAKLGGIEGYPYRETGDSIFWEGKLRDDVNIRLDLRVVQFDEKGLRVGGLATIWLGF